MQQRSARLVVIGAGPAGLATAGVALRLGVKPVVLDAGDQVGGAWAKMRPTMRCLSPRRFDQMPDGSVPGSATDPPDKRVTAADVARWLTEYAAREAFEVQLRSRVTSISRAKGLSRDDGELLITTTSGAWRSERCVVATGEFGRPRIPRISGLFAGAQVHSSALDLEQIPSGSRVVVVGARNSAAEVVPLLVARGAVVTVACRSGVLTPHIGVPTGWRASLLWRLSALPLRRLPGAGGCTVSTPAVGPTLENLAASGTIKVVGEVVALRDDGVSAKTAERATQELRCDTIVWATGFVRDVQWLPDAIHRDSDGIARNREGISTDWPELGFVGIPCQRTRRSGFIRGFTGDARVVLERLL